MDGARDQYEERLKEVFESFDGSGLGSLSPEELTDLCRALQLEENTLNTLLHTLLQDQISARVREHAYFILVSFFVWFVFLNAETFNTVNGQGNLSVDYYISETLYFVQKTPNQRTF